MEIWFKVMEKAWKSHGNPLVKMCMNPVGADNVRALYKRTLELDIEYKRLIIKKTRLEIEKLQYEKKVVHD